MTDDQGIILFLVIGAVVLAAIVGFGIRSSRKKARAQRPTFTTRLRWLGEQQLVIKYGALKQMHF